MLGTQALATLIAVYGVFMPPSAGLGPRGVWAYALAWFLVNDQVKLVTYRYLDRHPSPADSPVTFRPATTDRP